jgi:hypothetical protein
MTCWKASSTGWPLPPKRTQCERPEHAKTPASLGVLASRRAAQSEASAAIQSAAMQSLHG